MSQQSQSDRERDNALEDTFPASDAPASSGITGAGKSSEKPASGAVTEEPTGTPTSDRHSTETAHHDEDEVKPLPKP